MAMSNSGHVGANERANKRAKRIGVNLEVACGWTGELPHEWVFGPCPIRDNVWQCLPQVNLHGFDEGLVKKLNFGALELIIREGRLQHQKNATEVRIPCKSQTAMFRYVTFLMSWSHFDSQLLKFTTFNLSLSHFVFSNVTFENIMSHFVHYQICIVKLRSIL